MLNSGWLLFYIIALWFGRAIYIVYNLAWNRNLSRSRCSRQIARVLSLPFRKDFQRSQSCLQAILKLKVYQFLDTDLKANFSPFQQK